MPMNEFQVEDNLDKTDLPEWIGFYAIEAEKYLLSQGYKVNQCFSQSRGEYIRYNLSFDNPDILMFIAILRLDDGIYYHIDCELLPPDQTYTEKGTSLIGKSLHEVWNLKQPYRIGINHRGGFSVSTLGRLQDISKEFFGKLVREIVPVSNYLIRLSK